MHCWLELLLVAGIVMWLRGVLFSPFGHTLRAGCDSPLRDEAIGINVKSMRRATFVIAGATAGLVAVMHAFSKGSIS